jgi:Ni/Co efflux regulator RcnB
MNRSLIATVALAAAVGLSAPTFAQNAPGPADHNVQHDQHDQHAPSAHKPAPAPHGAPANHTTTTHHNVQVNRNVTVHRNVDVHRNVTVDRHVDNHPAPGPGYRWARGQRFEGNRREFSDYGRYNLRRPPPGYEWVQDGNELVLIALTTGVIAELFALPQG